MKIISPIKGYRPTAIDFKILRAWIVLKKPFWILVVFWEDYFSSMLDHVKDYIVDVWELRKARLYDENLSVPQSQCKNSSGELGDVGDSVVGRGVCMVRWTPPFHVCVCVELAPLSVLGAWSMPLVLWLPFECY